MTFDDLVRIALELPETVEGMSYGTPSVKRKKRFMFRLKEDGETIAIKMDWETLERLMRQSPEKYFKTPHYEGYPAFLARIELLSETDAREIVEVSWEAAPLPEKRR